MKKAGIIGLLVFILCGNKCFGQTIKTIDSLQNSYQACLDKGVNMFGCTKLFYHQMDDMLNLVYQRLNEKISHSQSAKLKVEEVKWLKKRDKYFNNVSLSKEEKSLGGEDEKMIILDKKAAFVKQRVIVLVRKLVRVTK